MVRPGESRWDRVSSVVFLPLFVLILSLALFTFYRDAVCQTGASQRWRAAFLAPAILASARV
jgi:hypothetical protein